MPELLFLSHRIPYPPDKGEKIRAWHMLQALGRAGWTIRLGCLVDDPADLAHLPALRAEVHELCAVPVDRRRRLAASMLGLRPGMPLSLPYFSHPRLHRWVRGVLASGHVSAAFAYSSAMAPYLMPPDEAGAGRADGDMVRVLDMVDVDSEKWASYAATAHGLRRLVWAREARTLLRFERRAATAFDRTLLVSPAECARLAELAPELAGRPTPPRLVAIENGVDLEHFSPAHAFPPPCPEGGPLLVFTGTMDYRPNVDAVCRFAHEVLPLLRIPHPGIRFAVVGASPAPEVRRLAQLAGVTVTGRVADPRPWMARADLVVAPLRIARGIQNKVLEAMAMGRPVLASAAAFEGVRAQPGRDLLVADEPEAVAALALEVLAGAHPELGARARLAMERGHAWSHTLRGLDALLRPASGVASGATGPDPGSYERRDPPSHATGILPAGPDADSGLRGAA